jgi:exodeoxyribonuclease-3
MKIITYNILDGFENAAQRKNDCGLWLQSQKPDIVFLNELNGFTDQSFSQYASIWHHAYSVLLNGRSDYKIGITSNIPLTNIEFYFKELLGHGVIICQRNNLTLINTHLNPHSITKRHHDLDFIISKIKPILNANRDLIFGGDLNSFFIGEQKFYDDEVNHLKKWYVKRTETNPKFENTLNGQFDFSISKRLQESTLVDLLSHRTKEYRPSYLSKLGKVPLHQDPIILENKLSVSSLSARIDYLWANPSLAQKCTACFIPQEPALEEMSDHLPIIAQFD